MKTLAKSVIFNLVERGIMILYTAKRIYSDGSVQFEEVCLTRRQN